MHSKKRAALQAILILAGLIIVSVLAVSEGPAKMESGKKLGGQMLAEKLELAFYAEEIEVIEINGRNGPIMVRVLGPSLTPVK